MRETPIFRNIQHSPYLGSDISEAVRLARGRIARHDGWFLHCLGNTAITKVVISLGVDRIPSPLRDKPMDRPGRSVGTALRPFLKDDLNSQSLSLQRVHFFDREASECGFAISPRDMTRVEQKLENVLLYVDFLPHELPVILLKDGSLLILFELAGLDYEGLSEEEKEQYSYYARTALEQLPDEGAGFMLSNLLVRDKPDPIPLNSNPQRPSADSVRPDRKQEFWNETLIHSYGNRILCGLRYFNPTKERASLEPAGSGRKAVPVLPGSTPGHYGKLEEGFLALENALGRFGFRASIGSDRFGSL